MKKILAGALAVAIASLATAPAQAWRGGGFGGFGGFHEGGGFVAHGPNGGWAAGGFHEGGAGGYGGTWHADGYHAGGYYGGYGYHGPVTVNSYYGGGCWGCGAAVGAAVGAAAVTGAAIAARNYAIGATIATLPGGCIARVVAGGSYYVCDGAWLQPMYGNNGVYYTVVNPIM